MHAIVYVSTIAADITDDDVERIVRKSRHNNQAAGITGLLVRCDDLFLQVIEGDEDIVEALYARIAADPRHHGLQRVAVGPLAERAFGHWSMGFENVGSAELASAMLTPLVEAGHLSHDTVKQLLLERFRVNAR